LQKKEKEFKMAIGFNTNPNSNGENKKLQISVDFRHRLILGETGSGKTASVITPIMFERMEKNHGILVFDFKGNYHYTIKALAKKKTKTARYNRTWQRLRKFH
jgi:DNA helicase HerA-like ATPase